MGGRVCAGLGRRQVVESGGQHRTPAAEALLPELEACRPQLIPTGSAGRACAAGTAAVASDLVLEAGFTSQRVSVFQNYVKAMRLFVGEPVWTAYNRPADHFEARGRYLDFLAQTV